MKIISAEFVKGVVGSDAILNDGVPQIAFVGRSNAGKSSLINSLINKKDLVRTGKRPGKTVEINFFKINGKFYFVDLPGYGYAKAGMEERERIRKLILWYLEKPETKPLAVVLILDIKAGFSALDKEMAEILREYNHHYVIAANKADKLGQKDIARCLDRIKKDSGEEDIVLCSAKTKKGIEVLIGKLF